MVPQSLAFRMDYSKIKCQNFFGIISNKEFLLDLILLSCKNNTLATFLAREVLAVALLCSHSCNPGFYGCHSEH